MISTIDQLCIVIDSKLLITTLGSKKFYRIKSYISKQSISTSVQNGDFEGKNVIFSKKNHKYLLHQKDILYI